MRLLHWWKWIASLCSPSPAATYPYIEPVSFEDELSNAIDQLDTNGVFLTLETPEQAPVIDVDFEPEGQTCQLDEAEYRGLVRMSAEASGQAGEVESLLDTLVGDPRRWLPTWPQ